MLLHKLSRRLLIPLLAMVLASAARIATAAPSFELTLCEDLPCLTNLGQPVVSLMAAWNTQHALMVARQMPYFSLRNTSSTERITSLSMTIGDAHYNFDAVRFVSASTPGLIPALDTSAGHPDAMQGGQRGDSFTVQFGAGLAPGGVAYFQLDLDADDPLMGMIPDFRTVLFDVNSDSGDLDNALVQVVFDRSLTQRVAFSDVTDPHFQTGPAVRLGYGMDMVRTFMVGGASATVVPEPSMLMLGAAGLSCLAMFRRRR